MRWQKAAVLLFAGVSLVLRLRAADKQDDDLENLKLSFWDKSFTLRGALGYKDNVLLSNVKPEGSAFWLSGLDFSLFRAGLDEGPTVVIFASAEDRRYFDSTDVPKEQLVLSQAKITQEFWGDWAIGGLVQYLYADQVFDASATEQLFETLPVTSHNIQMAPLLTRKLPWDSELEFSFNGERQLFNEPLDSYSEFGPRITFTKKYGNRSSAALSYHYDHRLYDTRLALGLDRFPIPDTPLRFDQHEFELSVTHAWDRERHWRSRVRTLFEMNEDSGVGFYDYDRYRVINKFGYYGKTWEVNVEGKLLHYAYAKQPVFGGNGSRAFWEYAAAMHAEKSFSKGLKLVLDYEYETVKSNYQLEEYAVNTVTGGVDWEF